MKTSVNISWLIELYSGEVPYYFKNKHLFVIHFYDLSDWKNDKKDLWKEIFVLTFFSLMNLSPLGHFP